MQLDFQQNPIQSHTFMNKDESIHKPETKNVRMHYFRIKETNQSQRMIHVQKRSHIFETQHHVIATIERSHRVKGSEENVENVENVKQLQQQ